MHGKGAMGKVMRAMGLMSGTSLDGIDIALIDTDGEDVVRRGPRRTVPYSPATRALLSEALADAGSIRNRHDRPGVLERAELELTEQHAVAVADFLAANEVSAATVDVIGFHGQTVLHKPHAGLTVQLGLGPMLADLTRCPVIFDMRAADVAAGGQGAPLVPAYHRALTAAMPQRPVAVVNIGGVANVTWIGADRRLLAFDTGPGSALIDDWMQRNSGFAFDQDGGAALRGRIDEDVVRFYLSNSYFASAPPKSLDRNAFPAEVLHGHSLEDGAATLAAFTARAIAKAREHMPAEPEVWIVSGGGRKNRAIMSMLAESVHHAVVPAEAVGIDGESVEAEAWAYLAVRSAKCLPLTFPETTGVEAPITGGLRADPSSHLVR